MSFRIERGHPLPFGATQIQDGINFALFSRNATDVNLLLYEQPSKEPVLEIALDPHYHRTGDVWHVFVQGLPPTIQYCYRLDKMPNPDPRLHRYDPEKLLLDPYGKAVDGGQVWGLPPSQRPPRRSVLVSNHFEWGDDQPLNIPLADSIIYELQVRGFTKHHSAAVAQPGTFRGLIEKIPYLGELGITAVELLPVYHFEEADTDRRNPLTNEPLLNLWGYHPISFFALNEAFASDTSAEGSIREFKEMVKAFHTAGIEVILDVVFNHTAEGDERGPTYSFRGIDNSVYYLLEPRTGEYRNYSGCGNAMNCNHPVVRGMIESSLRYWVMEMHVDGFRFDLASILGRGQDGSVLANPPLLESLAFDPILANTKLIAEAWDAAGLYQVGTFPAWGRWAEWNGRFRDDLRRFVKSDPGMVRDLAARMTGSPDLYESSGRQAHHSINFVTCHDGFTLADLVSYNHKHNEANGEDSRDGANENFSWNCGAEGPTTDPGILALRVRQQKNLATLLMLSGGVPMLLAGDEFGRTQGGNNNAYCQDNETAWVDWRLAGQNSSLLRFFQKLIAFRRAHPSLCRLSWPFQQDLPHTRVEFHGCKVNQPDWSYDSRSLAIQWIGEPGATENTYLIANAYWEPLDFELPKVPGRRWYRFLDTTLKAPDDVATPGQERYLRRQSKYTAGPRSAVVLVLR